MTNKKRFTAIGILTAVLIAIITCLYLNLYGNKVKGTYAATANARNYYINKTVNLPSIAKGSSFSFSSCGQNFNYIRFSATNGLQYMTNGSSSSEKETVVVYTSSDGWINELYRYIYVSDITGQDTPSYLLNNALERIAPVLYVGTYTWMNEPTDPYKNILQSNFNITSNGKNYIGINIYGSLDFRYVIAEGNEQFVYSFEGHDWGTKAFKTFTVEYDALVSDEFYTYLLSNFSSFVSAAEPATYTIEKGEYKGINTPTFSGPNMDQAMTFQANNITYQEMRIRPARNNIIYWDEALEYGYTAYNGAWQENSANIYLHENATASNDFYNWFTANFQKEEATSYTITYNLTNATKAISSPTEIKSNEQKKISISANSGYTFSENPRATNATTWWNGDEKGGILTITEPTGNVTVTATATKETPEEYSATITATATGSNANKIETISPNTLTLASGETQKIVVGITDNAYTVTQLNYETGISATFKGNVITVTADTLTENKTINLQISAGLNKASNEQYQAGYDDGEKAGYQSGVKDGEETGYNNGYTAGLEDGKANATVGQQLTYITQIKDSKIDIRNITPYLDSTKTTLNLGTIPGINSDDSYTAIRFSVNSDLIESDNINFTINWYNGGIVSGTNGFNTTFRAYATYTNTGVKSFDFKSVNNIYTITLPKTYNSESDTIKDFYFTLEKPMPTNIVIVSKSTEFTNGYNSGYTNGIEQGKETGYQQGKEEGYTEGKTQGYQDGYNKGIEEGASLNGLILSIAQVPIDFITNCFNVTILGINIAGLITGFITAAVVIWILKKLL